MRLIINPKVINAASYIQAEKILQKEENKNSASLDFSGNKGIVNYQPQHSDSINSISNSPPKQNNATIAKTIKWVLLIVGGKNKIVRRLDLLHNSKVSIFHISVN